ncbi:(2Fe-2S) ferredoxin domain-containing protein, partial [bacterium]|nr:(2Fe-2S) ferredoxin domain-containing protein [bacterium]
MIQTDEKKPILQVLVCTRTKEKGESCGAKGSAELRDQLKQWSKEQKISQDVKITASLCLGHCENGITACFQPPNQWFLKINATEDLQAFKDKI